MHRSTTTIKSNSEKQTVEQGQLLAQNLFSRPLVFVQLQGTLGAGKTAFSRGFISKWLELSGENNPEPVTSPTFNIVRTYGKKRPLAHFDLYRLKTFEELQNIGFEQYFYEMPACLVEWLEQIPEALSHMPNYAVIVEIGLGSIPTERILTIKDLQKSS